MVENRVDRCLKENVPAKYKIHKTVAAAVVVAIALVGTGGVYAAKIIFLTEWIPYLIQKKKTM